MSEPLETVTTYVMVGKIEYEFDTVLYVTQSLDRWSLFALERIDSNEWTEFGYDRVRVEAWENEMLVVSYEIWNVEDTR